MNPYLSAVIITKNEEKNIGTCISSLDFCDEVIVIDSGSTDSTCKIARERGAKVFHEPWKGYAEQKNYGNSQAAGQWILSLDADEEITDLLKPLILKAIQSNEFEAYKIPRKTYHSGQWIQYGGWYPNALIRLFKKNSGAWKSDEVHEAFHCTGRVGSLSEPFVHHSFASFKEQAHKNNEYSSLGAKKLRRNRQAFSILKLLVKPPLKFLETFVLKRGFLDGMRGYIIAVMAAHSVFLKWAKLWELESGEKKD